MLSAEELMNLERITRDYYIDAMSQKEIAQRVGKSQAHVARALKHARELGVIDFNIDRSFAIIGPERKGLAQTLRDRYKLKTCLVSQVDITGPYDYKQDNYLHTAIGNYTGSKTSDSITVGQYIAVAGGRAVHRTVEMIRRTPPSIRDVKISPLTGRLWAQQWQLQGAGSLDQPVLDKPIDADDCASVLAHAFDAQPGTRFSQISYPLYADSAQQAAKIIKEHCPFSPNGTWKWWGAPDRAFVGVGVVDPTGGHRMTDVGRQQPREMAPYLNQASRELSAMISFVRDNGLHFFADVANRLYATLPLPSEVVEADLARKASAHQKLTAKLQRLNNRSVVVTWRHIRQIPNVLAIAGGKLKHHAIWTLLIVGLLDPSKRIITDLSTDSATADVLITALADFEKVTPIVRRWYEMTASKIFEA